jgi:uncharacterized protein (DUF302 family)
MTTSTFTTTHIRVETAKPFSEVTRHFEQPLGKYEPAALQALSSGAKPAEARSRLEQMVGASGFTLFGTSDHGALLSLFGKPTRAIQYVVGNPLFAMQMTQHSRGACLYAPLRVLIYEDERGHTVVEYDQPSSLFGQFKDARVSEVASMLDRKLEALIAKSI